MYERERVRRVWGGTGWEGEDQFEIELSVLSFTTEPGVSEGGKIGFN